MQRSFLWMLTIATTLLIFSACNGTATPTPTPTSPPTETARPTATVTHSPTVSPSATATPEPTIQPSSSATLPPVEKPTSTPIPIVWAEPFNPIAVIPDFNGIWSPTANEMAGFESQELWVGNLMQVAEPDFSPQILDPEHAGKVFYQMTWSPDGQNILYGAYFGESEWELGIDYASEPWMITRNGEKAHPLLGEGYTSRGLKFPWWMDDHTVVEAGYAGGGHFGISQIDIRSGQRIVSDLVHVYQWARPQNGYLPVTSGVPSLTAKVVTRELQENADFDLDRYTRSFPATIVFPNVIADTYFLDWLPGTNQALVRVDGYTENGMLRRMFVWDVATDQVSNFIPGGMHACVSPDGENLVFTSVGAAETYDASIQGDLALDIVPENLDVYLQLMRLKDRQILFSLPLMTWDDLQNSNPEDFGKAMFSPDGRYLAFVTTGPLITDQTGWPVQVNAENADAAQFNILDLQNKRLLPSMPDCQAYYLALAWSPTGDRLVCGGSDNWYLIDLLKQETTTILQQGENQIHDPAWSYDGQFLSFMIRPGDFFDPNNRYTIIFKLDQPTP